MTVEPSADNPFFRLEPFFPLQDVSLDYLEHYKNDLIYHYERGFYNLALFSFHYLYMTLIHIYLLKYHRFEIARINVCLLAKPKKIKEPQKTIGYNFYSRNYKESEIIACFNIGDKLLSEQHIDLIRGRNEIAHASGVVLDYQQFHSHVSSAIGILETIKVHALNEMIHNSTFSNSMAMLDAPNNSDGNNHMELQLELIQSFFICEKDWKYLTDCGLMIFNDWQKFKDMIG